MKARLTGLVVGLSLAGTALFGGQIGHVVAQDGDPCAGLTPTIVATIGINKGTSGPDIIVIPEFVSATVYGNAGDDTICSASYNATVYGGAGNDRIDGLGELHGGANNDYITSLELIEGEAPDPSIYGDAGDDVIDVDEADFVDGGSGNDVIYASFSYEVHGGSGNDWLQIYSTYHVFGDSGDDEVRIGGGDLLDCGSGRDLAAVDDQDAPLTIKRCEIRETLSDS